MAVRIVQHAFDIINLLTDENPIQVLHPDDSLHRIPSLSVSFRSNPTAFCRFLPPQSSRHPPVRTPPASAPEVLPVVR